MKKPTSVYVLLLVGLAVAASHIGWTTRDNGTLMVLDGREIDAAGIAADQWTQMTRDCKGVVRLKPADDSYQLTVKLISAYSPPHSTSVRLAGVLAKDQWLVAEAEFTDLLPAVVLIDATGVQAHIVSNAVWSGYTKPWKAAPFIREYLRRQAPDMPTSLTACFDPQSRSFQ